MLSMNNKDILDLVSFFYKLDDLIMDAARTVFEDNFDYNTLLDTATIIEKQDIMSNKEWHDIYERNKNNIYIIRALIELPYKVPNDIIEDIVFNSNIVYKNLSKLVEQNLIERKVLIGALKHPISNVAVDEIYNNILVDSYNMFDICGCMTEATIKSLDKNVLNRIGERVIRSAFDIETGNCDKSVSFLEFVKDKEFLKKLSNDNSLHELIRTAVSNNIYLDPENNEDAEIINNCFDNGVDIKLLKKHTAETKENISQIYFDRLKNDYDKDCVDFDSVYFSRLKGLAISNLLGSQTEKQIMDFIEENDLLFEPDFETLYTSIFTSSSNEILCDKIYDVPLEILIKSVSENRKQSNEFYVKAINRILENYDRNPELLNANTIAAAISSACVRTTLEDKHYEFIFENAETISPILKLFISAFTPANIVSDLLDCVNYEDKTGRFSSQFERINLVAYANLLYQKNKISLGLYNAFTYLIFHIPNEAKTRPCQNDYKDDFFASFNSKEQYVKSGESIENMIKSIDLIAQMPFITEGCKNFLTYCYNCIKEIEKDNSPPEYESVREEFEKKSELLNLPFYFATEDTTYMKIYSSLDAMVELKDLYDRKLQPHSKIKNPVSKSEIELNDRSDDLTF